MSNTQVAELLPAKRVGEFLATYSLWESGKNRFVVTPGRSMVPVLGYVTRKTDKIWMAEKRGKILPAIYPSVADAAKALIDSPECSAQ